MNIRQDFFYTEERINKAIQFLKKHYNFNEKECCLIKHVLKLNSTAYMAKCLNIAPKSARIYLSGIYRVLRIRGRNSQRNLVHFVSNIMYLSELIDLDRALDPFFQFKIEHKSSTAILPQSNHQRIEKSE